VKIPEKIKVGGHWITILYPYQYQERDDYSGHYDEGEQKLFIAGTTSKGAQRAESQVALTFLHELVHAADILSGHEVFQNNEKAIEGITEVLFQILRDNKLHFDEE
jgi:hypothetical protein